MKTTKQLFKELEDKSVFLLAWAIFWRAWAVAFGVGFVIGFLGAL